MKDTQSPEPTLPKPSIPKPDIPRPSLPKPDIPKPTAVSTPSPTIPTQPKVSNTPPPEPVSEIEEEIEIEEEDSLFFNRLVAGLIDSAIAAVLILISSAILPDILGLAAIAVGIAYLLTRDTLPFLGGQSVGKKVMKLRAVTQDDQTLINNWQVGITRNILLAIPIFGGIAELAILYTREQKPEVGLRLGDQWAKTKVVSAS